MATIKEELTEVISQTMIPEVESYIEELHELLQEGKATDDDMSAIKEMESFLVELENILLAIKEDKISDEQAQEVHENIMQLLQESEKAQV
ncbi:hypothetical protein [Candidatus Marinarcus aquaticus]|uniref:Uncharacterized protein n=1 Tax=Candidatus Marinarcus aquaticus TaxID=2044504 RepID=A0A4Q0XVN3_9BACT|nr:hypothetical protein [Candidatus Marinarcus aquaticus]RXJ60694.1 hypothetical protein CRV04_01390 [Candidatus Marinarcus aquaticus]